MLQVIQKVTILGVSLALLSACAGGAMSPSGALETSGASRGSLDGSHGVIPSASSSTDMIYVSAGSRVKVYTYPALDEVGQITGLHDPLGMCSDTSGNVFVTDPEAQAIFEFAHGGTKKIANLKDTGWEPHGCSVDPATGDLAVANYCQGTVDACSQPGNIAIYKGAKGKPRSIALDGLLNNASFCGYDDNGNLFVDGIDASSNTSLSELAKGASNLHHVTIQNALGVPENVQWDGTYVSVGDATANEIHRFTIVNYEGTEVQPVTSDLVKHLGQTWIQGGNVFIPNAGRAKSGNIVEASYPEGWGAHHLLARLGRPFGVTYSVAP